MASRIDTVLLSTDNKIKIACHPPIPDIDSMSVDDLIGNLRLEMNKLSALEDMNLEDANYPLIYIKKSATRAGSKKETAIFDFFVEVKFVELCRKIIKNHFNEMCKEKKVRLYYKIDCLINVVLNFSYESEKFCDEILKTGLHKDYIEYLKTDYFSNSKIDDPTYMGICKAFISTLYNVLQFSKMAREALRSNGFVDVCQTFRSSTNQFVKCHALMAQAYMVTEYENDKLNSDISMFQYLIEVLEAATNGVEIDDATFSVEEVLNAINRLAANDNNKKMIIDAGGLSYYVSYLKHERGCSQQATAMAAHGIWILGFKCREEIVKFDGCMQALQNLLKHPNEHIKKEAKGALWILEDKTCTIAREEDKSGQHIFISYQWDSKETVLKVRDHLEIAGVKTWIDVDDMSGSILEAMANAVEKASVVIICLSQKYKYSTNCRTEAEYTFKRKKKVIPLLLQTNYEPDGWLGALVGNKPYFDFSVHTKFDDSLKSLLKEIETFRGQGHGTNEIDGPVEFRYQ